MTSLAQTCIDSATLLCPDSYLYGYFGPNTLALRRRSRVFLCGLVGRGRVAGIVLRCFERGSASRWAVTDTATMGCGASTLDTNHEEQPYPEERSVQQQQVPFEVQQAEDRLLQAWGGVWTTTGYTDGHHCIKDSDTDKAEQAGASLLYGEVLPAGMCRSNFVLRY